VLVLCLGCGKTSLQGETGERDCPDAPCAPGGLYPGPCTTEHRVGEDLVVQSGSILTYDERCRLVLSEQDFDGDGHVDLSVAYSYDGRGLLVGEERRHDGGLLELWSYGYDGDGNEVLVEMDREGDGVIDFWIEYDRNERGDVLEERSYAAGELTGWTVTTYDDVGGVVTVEEHQHFCIDWTVFTGDVVSRRTTYTNDGDGHVTVVVDGVECEVADGVIDVRIERTFDDSGNLLSERVDGTSVTPGPPDGVYDACTTYEYDANGTLVRIEWDGGMGEPSGGHALCDGSPDNVSTRIHDAEGREVRIENDYDADGDLEEVISTSYDPCGNRTGMEAWREAEDRTVWTNVYGYGCWE
jgi:hypothetical protein